MYEPDFQCDGNTAPVIAPSPAVWSKSGFTKEEAFSVLEEVLVSNGYMRKIWKYYMETVKVSKKRIPPYIS